VSRDSLSVRVFHDGSRFGWTLNAASNEVLSHGTAVTEFKARVDAFHAAMTYIDRAPTICADRHNSGTENLITSWRMDGNEDHSRKFRVKPIG
jgi:hypothetical protein